MTSFSGSQFPEPGNISQPSPNLLTPGSLAQISQDLQRSIRPEVAELRTEVEQLRRRFNFLTRMVTALALILSGVSIWLAIRTLSLEQSPKVSSVNAELSEIELTSRLETLEKDFKTLRKSNTTDLSTTVQNNEEQLQKVIQQVKRLSADMQTLQNAIEDPDPPLQRSTPVPEVQRQDVPLLPTPSPQSTTQPQQP